MRHRVGVCFHLRKEITSVKLSDNLLTRNESVLAVELFDCFIRLRNKSVDHMPFELQIRRQEKARFRIEDVDWIVIAKLGALLPLPNLEVIEIMRRCDLNRASALLRIGIFIGDDRNAAPHQW